MRVPNKQLCVFWIGCCVAWTCLGSEPLTVDSAVEAAKQKRKKGVEVAESPMPLPAALSLNLGALALPSPAPPPPSQPKLWSIKGINDQFVAEIFYEGKIYPLSLKVGEKFQRWTVSAYDHQSVTLAEKKTPKPKPPPTASSKPPATPKASQTTSSPPKQKVLATSAPPEPQLQTLTLTVMPRGQTVASQWTDELTQPAMSTAKQAAATLPAPRP